MGPFETIELNAPGGIPDYCRRSGAVLSPLPDMRRQGYLILAVELSACVKGLKSRLSAADPAIYCGKGLDHVLAEWGEAPTQEQIALQMRARDRRLAALKAHKALNC